VLPTSGKSPEEWIGEQVLVEVLGGRVYRVVVSLDGINDWGVVLTGEGVDPGGGSVFFPWRHVMAMRLARPEDQPPDHREARG
jgi:hypothetical protein